MPTYKISIEVGRSVVHSENTTHDYSPHAKPFGNYTYTSVHASSSCYMDCLTMYCVYVIIMYLYYINEVGYINATYKGVYCKRTQWDI